MTVAISILPAEEADVRRAKTPAVATEVTDEPWIDSIVRHDGADFFALGPRDVGPWQQVVGKFRTSCTGTLIGPRHVLTAAHCVVQSTADYVRMSNFYGGHQLDFAPGQMAGERPHDVHAWTLAVVPEAWTDPWPKRYDVAVVVLEEPIGEELGFLPVASVGELKGVPVALSGYPREPMDKVLDVPWFSACSVSRVEDGLIHYPCAGTEGMSGSAVIDYTRDGGAVVIGVHAYAPSEGETPPLHKAVLFDQAVLDFVRFALSL